MTTEKKIQSVQALTPPKTTYTHLTQSKGERSVQIQPDIPALFQWTQ